MINNKTDKSALIVNYDGKFSWSVDFAFFV